MARRKRKGGEVKGVVSSAGHVNPAMHRYLSDPFNHRSWLLDPYSATLQMGRPSKPSLLSFDVMRSMAVRSPTLRALFNLRKNQVASFTRRPAFPGDRGFRVALKDAKADMSRADRQIAWHIEEFFLNTGREPSPARHDNFNIFMRKLIEDSLTFDNAAMELVYDRQDRLSEIWAVDGSTIEFVLSDVWQPQTPLGQEADAPIQYIQSIVGQAVAEYTADEMALFIRNPQTNLAYFGYGISELETLVSEITTELFILQAAQSTLSRGSIPDGIIVFKGDGFNEESLEDFQRAWRTLGSGPQSAGTMQALSIGPNESVELLSTHDKPRDLVFPEMLELTRVQICDVYGVDLSELNAWRKAGSRGALIDSDATKTRIEFSLDKGFMPLMRYFADKFSAEIVDRLDDRFRFEWVGLSKTEEEGQLQNQIQRLQWGLATINDIRAERDEKVVEEAWANAPLNPQLFQAWMAEHTGQLKDGGPAKEARTPEEAAQPPAPAKRMGPSEPPAPTQDALAESPQARVAALSGDVTGAYGRQATTTLRGGKGG